MALTNNEVTTFSRFQQDYAVFHRPMMLKDFLRDESPHSCTSSASSNGFPMYRRKKPCKSTVVVSSKSNNPSIVLLRSWSKKAATAKISAVHRVIKLLQFASVKSPSVFSPSFSRKLSKRSKGKNDIFGDAEGVKVKVKDILRWRSFRDVVEDNCTPLDCPSSPHRSTTTTTTTTTSSCSKRSSWCDSDFTAEELPPWGGENEEFTKGDWSFEESEQRSPVSVLDSPFRQVEEFISPNFHPTFANIQRAKCNLTRRIQELGFEGETAVSEGPNAAEEQAIQLLNHIKEDNKSHIVNDQVILDFFMHELSINGKLHDDEFDRKILRMAGSWINGEFDGSYEWEMEDRRESYVQDMEKEVCWNKFKQEQQEMSKELEIKVLNDLIDDLLVDLLAR